MLINNNNEIYKRIFDLLIKFLPSKKSIVNSKEFGIVSLLCHKDVSLFTLNLTSFFYYLEKQYPIFVISDGSLNQHDCVFLYRHFSIEIKNYKEVESLILKKIGSYKYYMKYWTNKKTNIRKHKIDAVILSPFKKFIYLDADIIFFKKPIEIIRWIQTDTNIYFITEFNKTFKSKEDHKNHETYFFRKLLYQQFGIKNEPYFNSAFICFPNKNFLDFKRINYLLRIFENLGYIYSHFTEETIFAILFQKVKYLSLNPNKYLNSGHIDKIDEIIMRHYPLYDKKYLYRNGIETIIKNYFYRLN